MINVRVITGNTCGKLGSVMKLKFFISGIASATQS